MPVADIYPVGPTRLASSRNTSDTQYLRSPKVKPEPPEEKGRLSSSAAMLHRCTKVCIRSDRTRSVRHKKRKKKSLGNRSSGTSALLHIGYRSLEKEANNVALRAMPDGGNTWLQSYPSSRWWSVESLDCHGQRN